MKNNKKGKSSGIKNELKRMNEFKNKTHDNRNIKIICNLESLHERVRKRELHK